MTLSPRETIRVRARIEGAIRAHFAQSGAIEVQTPSLVANPGLEPQLRAFAVNTAHCPELGPRWLHTSPEYAIKATFADLDADVFTFARSYRNEPTGRWHHPEFTMLEWYRRTDGMEPVMRDVEAILSAAWTAAHEELGAGGAHAPPALPFDRLRVAEAFQRHAGVNPVGAGAETLRRAATALGLAPEPSWDRATLFSLLYSFVIEPELARERPVFLTHFPAEEAALARLDPDDPAVALRFEVYAGARGPDGAHVAVELANAFVELTDAEEQRSRFEQDLATRAKDGSNAYPMPEAMLAGIEHMPATTGIALGVERLLVWAVEAAAGRETRVSDFLLGEPRPSQRPPDGLR